MRRAARTDSNQSEVIEAFRKMGCTVAVLSSLGNGVPDLLVARGGNRGHGGRQALVEVKDGNKAPSDRALTPDQEKFIQKWNGPVYVVETLDEVQRVFNALA